MHDLTVRSSSGTWLSLVKPSSSHPHRSNQRGTTNERSNYTPADEA